MLIEVKCRIPVSVIANLLFLSVADIGRINCVTH